MRIDTELLERLDTWRSNEDDAPSRAEAIRRLVESGLAHDNKGRAPHFTDGEKLITMMLVDLHKKLKVEGETDVEFVSKVIYGGHYWALGWEMTGLFHAHSDKQTRVRFVVDVLDMWSFIKWAMDSFNPEQKARIAEEAKPIGDHVEFYGFDGNNESDYLSIARFLTEDMDRFSELKGKGGLNSHHPTVDIYRRMLSAFLPMRASLVGRNLSPDQVIAILQERLHPSHRGRVIG